MSEYDPRRYDTGNKASDRSLEEQHAIMDQTEEGRLAMETDEERYQKLQDNQIDDYREMLKTRGTPEVRRMLMIAQDIQDLRHRPVDSRSEAYLNQIKDKEDKLEELLLAYDEQSQSDPNYQQRVEEINFILSEATVDNGHQPVKAAEHVTDNLSNTPEKAAVFPDSSAEETVDKTANEDRKDVATEEANASDEMGVKDEIAEDEKEKLSSETDSSTESAATPENSVQDIEEESSESEPSPREQNEEIAEDEQGANVSKNEDTTQETVLSTNSTVFEVEPVDSDPKARLDWMLRKGFRDMDTAEGENNRSSSDIAASVMRGDDVEIEAVPEDNNSDEHDVQSEVPTTEQQGTDTSEMAEVPEGNDSDSQIEAAADVSNQLESDGGVDALNEISHDQEAEGVKGENKRYRKIGARIFDFFGTSLRSISRRRRTPERTTADSADTEEIDAENNALVG